MNVLSLFDGMSCGQIALERAGIKIDKYFASEIDKFAIAVTQYNYPNTIQLGDINNMEEWDLPQIDLIMGGSPCQGFSFTGKQLNFNDPRSKLFFKFVDAIKKFKPKYFLLENVRMKKEYQDVISSYLEVEPIVINSNILSAQNRVRLYWTNIDFDEKTLSKENCPINLINIIEETVDEKYFLNNINIRELQLPEAYNVTDKGIIKLLTIPKSMHKDNERQRRLYSVNGKSPTLLARSDTTKILIGGRVRKLTPLECERLQTIPDNYTLVPYGKGIMSNSQRYKMIGNGWTVDIIVHILKNISGK